MNYQGVINTYTLLAKKAETVNATLGKRTIILLAISFIIIFTSILLIDNWIRLFNHQTAEIINTRKALNNLHELKFQVAHAESAQRSFLMTGHQKLVASFNNAMSAARQNIAFVESDLEKQPSKDQEAIDLLNTSASKLEVILAEMQVTIKLAQSGNVKSAIGMLNMDDGFDSMFALNQAIDQLINRYYQNIDTKVDIRHDNTIYARCLIILSSFVWLALVVLVLKQMMGEMSAKEHLKLSLTQEKDICEKKLSDQNVLVRTLALDYQADVERERRKLSSELHDELGAIFTATKMDISWLIKKLNEPIAPLSAKAMIEKLQKTTQYINKGISFHRRIIEQLNPAGLSVLGIWPAMRSLITDAAERNNWKLTLDLPNDATPLNETIALVAYRLVQETLNNANKYAKADAISVIIMMDETYLKVEIEDNGVGIDLTAQTTGAFGIAGMRNRIVAIGGNFKITSELGKGVLTLALIPLKVTGI